MDSCPQSDHDLAKPDSNNEWLHAPTEQQGLKRYVETLRERIWLIVLAVVITTGAAVAYVATADEVYEAEADILISPVADEQASLVGLALIGESSDPLRAVETAAALIATNAAAAGAIDELGLDSKPDEILKDVKVEPVAESDIVTVTAEGPTPQAATDLANAFAAAALRARTDVLHQTIDAELPPLEARLEQLEPGVVRDELTAQVGQLEALRAGDDPTLQITEPATPPNSPVSPRRAASVVAGVVAGLILGIGGAFAVQVLDPRLRRESQLRDRYRLPVLARVPRERARAEPLRWDNLSAGSTEAYRSLRAILARPRLGSRGGGSVLVTSPGPSEGKTTSAINLATSLALAGNRTILIEADLRRPSIGRALEIAVDRGVVSVLIGQSTLEESLVKPPGTPNLELLLADQSGPWGGELLSLPAAQSLIEEAKRIADYVVVDSPPLATVVDALPLVRPIDDVLLVVKLGVSRLDRIHELAERLAEAGITPAGFAVIGVPRGPESPYYGNYRPLLTARGEPRAAARTG